MADAQHSPPPTLIEEVRRVLRLQHCSIYRIREARKAVSATGDVAQALDRKMQLAVRAAIGTRDLDTFLAEKDAVARENEQTLRQRAEHWV